MAQQPLGLLDATWRVMDIDFFFVSSRAYHFSPCFYCLVVADSAHFFFYLSPDLASANKGGKVLETSDELFGEGFHLIKDGSAIEDKNRETANGFWKVRWPIDKMPEQQRERGQREREK